MMQFSGTSDFRGPLAIIMPAFNEAQTVGVVVKNAAKHGIVIVVDDGSTDCTAEVAEASGAFVVSHPANRGYDGALQTGLEAALKLGCLFAIVMDADGQHDSLYIEEFYRELVSGADLVVGERDKTQRWSEAVFGAIARLSWGLKDPLCGMKGYRLDKITSKTHFNTYRSVGTELAIILSIQGAVIAQPQVKVKKRLGKSRFGQGYKANIEIIRALCGGLKRSAKMRRTA